MKTRTGFAHWTAATLLLGVCSTEPALAGVIDSPLAVIQAGARTKHIFTVPGVVSTTLLATLFQCTSLETAAVVTVAVEVFGAAGGAPLNNVTAGGSSDGTVLLAVGETKVISTQPLGGGVTSNDALALGGTVEGSARILSTSTKIACAATVMGAGATPGYLNNLPVLKGKRQRGD